MKEGTMYPPERRLLVNLRFETLLPFRCLAIERTCRHGEEAAMGLRGGSKSDLLHCRSRWRWESLRDGHRTLPGRPEESVGGSPARRLEVGLQLSGL